MAQTFSNGKTTVLLVDPTSIHRNRARFRRPMMRKLALANSLYVPLGGYRARGWILLTYADYNSISGYGNFTLTVQSSGTTSALTFNQLAIVNAECATTGVLADADTVYLVEITDQRGIISSPWFELPTISYYNVLAPAYPGTYYTNSLNGGSAWTWNTMVQNLWNQIALLGTYPGLPVTPTGTPTNWNLNGVSAWKALTAMLSHIGCAISCDLTQTSPYGIVQKGASDATYSELSALYAKTEEDLQPIDIGSGRVPGSVLVYFRRVNQYYGTEETVRSDSSQWATNAVYSVPVAAPAQFSGAVGTGFLWDDFPVRYDINGSPLAADVITAAAIAAERVTQFYDNIYSGTLGYMNRVYPGLIPFYAGSQVDGVRWYQDYSQGRGAWRTQIVRGLLPDIWPGVYGAESR